MSISYHISFLALESVLLPLLFISFLNSFGSFLNSSYILSCLLLENHISYLTISSKREVEAMALATITTCTHGHFNYNIFSMFPNKLDRTNYLYWRNQIECALRNNKFMKYLARVESCPLPRLVEDQPNPDYDKWMMEDDWVLGWIDTTIANQYQLMLFKCKTTYEGWNHLEKILSPMSNTQVSVIKEQLRTLKKLGTEGMQDYMMRAKGLVESLASTGEILSESSLADYILGGLGTY